MSDQPPWVPKALRQQQPAEPSSEAPAQPKSFLERMNERVAEQAEEYARLIDEIEIIEVDPNEPTLFDEPALEPGEATQLVPPPIVNESVYYTKAPPLPSMSHVTPPTRGISKSMSSGREGHRFADAPRAIYAKFDSSCWDCGRVIYEGSSARWSPHPDFRGIVAHPGCTHPFDDVVQKRRTPVPPKVAKTAEVAEIDQLAGFRQLLAENQDLRREVLDLNEVTRTLRGNESVLTQRIREQNMTIGRLQHELTELRLDLAGMRERIHEELVACIGIVRGVYALVVWAMRAALSDVEKRFSLLELD